MRDHLRRSRAIPHALAQGSPGEPTGRVARHLTTLAALLSGIVGRKRPQLPPIAPQVPEGTKPASRVKRLPRWLDNDHLLEAMSFVPSAALGLTPWALETLGVVMEGRVVGRGCLALLLHGGSKGRALPLAWCVRHSPTGHGPEALPIAVVARRRAGIPAGAQGGLLGDGACAGTALQAMLKEAGWSSVCRTAMHTTATWDGPTFRLATLGACLTPGRLIA
jgi:hypothetical protein